MEVHESQGPLGRAWNAKKDGEENQTANLIDAAYSKVHWRLALGYQLSYQAAGSLENSWTRT